MNAKYEREPTLTRKTNKKNSTVFWSERGLRMFCYEKLQTHMTGLGEELSQLFNQNRALLPKNSELWAGGIHGCWKHCPNAIADEVEAIVRRRHDEYHAQNYNEADLAKVAYGWRDVAPNVQ